VVAEGFDEFRRIEAAHKRGGCTASTSGYFDLGSTLRGNIRSAIRSDGDAGRVGSGGGIGADDGTRQIVLDRRGVHVGQAQKVAVRKKGPSIAGVSGDVDCAQD